MRALRVAGIIVGAGLCASMAVAQPAPADCVLDRKMPIAKVQATVERCIPIGMTDGDVAELFRRNHLTPDIRRPSGTITASMPGPSRALNWLLKTRVYFTVEFDGQGLVTRRTAVSMGDFF